MAQVPPIFKRSNPAEWTLERIGRLPVQEIKQLRDNAERLNEPAVVALCNQALKDARSSTARARVKPAQRGPSRRLVARAKAFESRGVQLEDARTSWGGVRKTDGAIVLAIWADAIESANGVCRYLLWAPNVDGARPWSDKPAGKERLVHCGQAIALGRAEGLLVYGERLDGQLPEDKAHSVHGIDADTVLQLQVEMRGAEYWAIWGKKAVG